MEDAVYLNKIEIRGLFGYKNITWDVFKDVNILGGTNGSGKSTLFNICHLLLGYGYITEPRYANLVKMVRLTFSNGHTMIWDKQKIRHEMERVIGYTYHDISPNKVEKDGSFVVQRTKVTDGSGNDIDLETFIKTVKTSFLSSFEQTILDSQKVSKEGKDRTYLDVLLTSYIAYRNARVSQILINSLNELSQNTDNDQGHRLTIKGKDARYIVLFNQALMHFFGENYTIKAGMESQISMTSKRTGEVINYQDLSLGEKELLLLIVSVSNTFDEPVLMWLDEPDLGLHVDWQEELVTWLRSLNPNVQLFISTHAPSMVEGNQKRVTEMSEISMQ